MKIVSERKTNFRSAISIISLSFALAPPVEAQDRSAFDCSKLPTNLAEKTVAIGQGVFSGRGAELGWAPWDALLEGQTGLKRAPPKGLSQQLIYSMFYDRLVYHAFQSQSGKLQFLVLDQLLQGSKPDHFSYSNRVYLFCSDEPAPLSTCDGLSAGATIRFRMQSGQVAPKGTVPAVAPPAHVPGAESGYAYFAVDGQSYLLYAYKAGGVPETTPVIDALVFPLTESSIAAPTYCSAGE